MTSFDRSAAPQSDRWAAPVDAALALMALSARAPRDPFSSLLVGSRVRVFFLVGRGGRRFGGTVARKTGCRVRVQFDDGATGSYTRDHVNRGVVSHRGSRHKVLVREELSL